MIVKILQWQILKKALETSSPFCVNLYPEQFVKIIFTELTLYLSGQQFGGMEGDQPESSVGEGEEGCSGGGGHPLHAEPCQHHHLLQPLPGWGHVDDRSGVCQW